VTGARIDTTTSGTLARVGSSLAAGRQRPAVTADDGDLTGDELAGRAAAIADGMRRLGLGAGQRVALCLDRSASLVVATLAVAQAGAAYVAVDPSYPAQRIAWMIEDSGAAAVICPAHLPPPPGSSAAPVIAIADGGCLQSVTVPDGWCPPGVPGPWGPELAYIVYTSGSTGRPKGVAVSWAGLDNLVEWHLAAFALSAEDRCSQLASPGFDAAAWEMWPCLAAGAALHVVPDRLRTDPAGLRDWMAQRRINVGFVPTALAEALMALRWPAQTALRCLLTGGDALARRPPVGLPFPIVNNYGLSETTVVATSGLVAAGDGPRPGIGRPITGVITDVVDAALDPVEPGRTGELLVAGVALCLGYLHPSDGSDRFVQRGGRRWLRTGDLVRQTPDGELGFMGRLDDQVSIRGHRVEPGEVSAVLNTHPGVASSVTVAAGEGLDRRLIAYIVSADIAVPSPTPAELDGWLRRLVPDYMIPARYVWVNELPVTAHGKVDQSALPAPTPWPATAGGAPDDDAGDLEGTISAVVAELLGRDSVGTGDNFFLLGGHSMLGAQLIMRLEEMFGVELSLRRLFDNPTVAGITAQVRTQAAGSPAR
jgi:amino acid adenylation domain-containing protein